MREAIIKIIKDMFDEFDPIFKGFLLIIIIALMFISFTMIFNALTCTCQ